MVMVKLMAMMLVLVKEVVRELRLMLVWCGDVARVLAVEPEFNRRWVIVMVVLIRWRVLRERTVLETLGLGGLVHVDGVGLVGDGKVRG